MDKLLWAVVALKKRHQESFHERGDLVWLSFTPHAGHEQAGPHCQGSRRPALVLSPRAYHQKTGYALVCPITSRLEGYPFEVLLPEGLPIEGAVLADQIKSVDPLLAD